MARLVTSPHPWLCAKSTAVSSKTDLAPACIGVLLFSVLDSPSGGNDWRLATPGPLFDVVGVRGTPVAKLVRCSICSIRRGASRVAYNRYHSDESRLVELAVCVYT